MNERRILGILVLAGLPAFADTVAVLPFWNGAASPPPSLEWIGESVAETVREALGSRGILTLDRDALQDAFHGLGLRERVAVSEASVMKIGEALDAEQVVYGNFDFTPDAAPRGVTPGVTPGVTQGSTQMPGPRGSLKISARVVDRRRMHIGPEFVETGAIEDLATLEAHLAWRALTLVAPKLAPPESEFRTLRTPIRLDAEEKYVRGLLAHDPAVKENFFLQAARLDPRFAHACYQLGQIHYQRKEYRQAAEWLEKIGPEEIHFREATFLLGLARFWAGDYAGAQKAFQMIAATVPLGEVYNNLGASESRRNLPQAIEDFRKAVEGDASDPVYRFNLGYALWKKADFAAAADQFRAVLDRTPEDQVATLLLGRCLKKQSLNPADARLVSLERLKSNYEERAYWQLKSLIQPKPVQPKSQ